MSIDINLASIVQTIFLAFGGISLWFLKGIHGDFKKLVNQVNDHEVRIRLLEKTQEK